VAKSIPWGQTQRDAGRQSKQISEIESALQSGGTQLGLSDHPGPESGGLGVEDKPLAAIENVPAASVHFIF
jgi:hypothetical protein